MMYLESLPNEILLDLFKYINSIDLLQTFYGLNSRFNLLLYKRFRFFRFRFRHISKRHFDLICQQHLPCIADQVIALELIDYNDTPNQINLFCSYIRSFSQFTHLRTLDLYQLHSYQILLKLLNECQHLCYLTDLNFYSCSFSDPSTDIQLIIDKIWSLPKLADCHFGISIEEKKEFCVPTIISSSLINVSIPNIELEWDQIKRLFDSTSHLAYLSVSIKSSVHDNYTVSPFPNLIYLILQCSDKSIVSKLPVIFQNMPNLRRLDVDTFFVSINGHQWEEIIRYHLPKLETFRLTMLQTFFLEPNCQELVDELVNSFRSSFWIDERQWFIRCIIWKETIHLYTSSNESNDFRNWIPDSWQSTDPHDNQQQLYNQIAGISDEKFFNQPTSSNICFPNLNYLYIKLPINRQFWSIVPNFDQLKSLTVSSHNDIFKSQLQTLLDRAPHLTELTIRRKKLAPLQMSLLKYTNKSIRQIDLRDYNHRFNEEECLLLSRSPLGIQCEVLSIQIQNCESIIVLVKNMLNLRSLHVYWNDEKHYERLKRAKNHVQYKNEATQMINKVVQWLNNNLPSTCLIAKNLHNRHYIVIWI